MAAAAALADGGPSFFESLSTRLLNDREVREILWTLLVDSSIMILAYLWVWMSKWERDRDYDEVEHMTLNVETGSDPLYESVKSGGHMRTPPHFRFRSTDRVLGSLLPHFSPLGRHLREAALYLRFHALACTLFIVLSMIGLIFLAPIYSNSPGNNYASVYSTSLIEQFTATNLSVASPRLLISFICILLFSGVAWLWVRQYYTDIVQLVRAPKRDQSNDVIAYTVLFRGLQPSLVKEKRLLNHFKAIFGSRVLACRIATLNAISGSSSDSGTGHAFVCFSSQKLAREVIEMYSGTLEGKKRLDLSKGPSRTLKGRKRALLNDRLWRAESAPPPSDIVWKNLIISETQRGARGIAINVGLFVLMTLIIAPVAVIDRLEPLVQSLEDVAVPDKLKHREVRRFVGNYFPTLVVFFMNSILLPFLIEFSSHREGHHTESARSAAVVRRNAVFQFINTILLPSLALNSAAGAMHLAYQTNFEDWEMIIGSSLQKNTSARFFVIYLIHATLLGCASELMQLPRVGYGLLTRFKKCMVHESATMDTSKDHLAWEFDFGYYYGARLTIMGLTLLYSVLVPIIAPIGAIYFLLNYWTDGHNLRSGVYTVSFDSNGALPISVLRYVLWYITLFLFTMSCYFTVQGTLMFFVLGIMLLMVSVASLLCSMLTWRPDPSGLSEEEEELATDDFLYSYDDNIDLNDEDGIGHNREHGRNSKLNAKRKDGDDEDEDYHQDISSCGDGENELGIRSRRKKGKTGCKEKERRDDKTMSDRKHIKKREETFPSNPARDRAIMYDFLRSYVCPFQVSVVSVLQDPLSSDPVLAEENE